MWITTDAHAEYARGRTAERVAGHALLGVVAPPLLSLVRADRADPKFGCYELLCRLFLAVEPARLPMFVADACEKRRDSWLAAWHSSAGVEGCYHPVHARRTPTT